MGKKMRGSGLVDDDVVLRRRRDDERVRRVTETMMVAKTAKGAAFVGGSARTMACKTRDEGDGGDQGKENRGEGKFRDPL